MAKGFELIYQPDDETEIVRDLLYDVTNRVICEIDHTADKTGIRKCRPGIACCFFKKFHRINRPPTPVLEIKAKHDQKLTPASKGGCSTFYDSIWELTPYSFLFDIRSYLCSGVIILKVKINSF